MERRHFLMSAAAVAGASATAGASPNETIRVAVVGVRGQGNAHLQNYSKMKNVEIAAIVDIDDAVIGERLGTLKDKYGVEKKPAVYKDIRKMLEDQSIDAVSIATPNHSHTLQTIWSLQAGKHVYIEKPCSHDIFEAKQIMAAHKKYGKIVQHGVNARSSGGVKEAVQQMRDGLIGDVYLTRGLCFKWRDTIGRAKVEPVPSGVDYDLWQGPAQVHPFTKNRFHYNWHWFWEYGNGDIGNQGIHEIDICRWGLGVKYPKRVSAIGGHFMFDDDQETPNTLTATYEFDEGGKRKMMEFAVRHWMSNHEAEIGAGGRGGGTIGNVFYGSKGYLAIDGYNKYQTWLGREQTPGPSKNEPGNNWQNFIDAVRENKPELQNNPIEEGAISTVLMHLANISYRVGRTVEFDAEKMAVVGDAEANKLLKRNYRKGFEVPEKV